MAWLTMSSLELQTFHLFESPGATKDSNNLFLLCIHHIELFISYNLLIASDNGRNLQTVGAWNSTPRHVLPESSRSLRSWWGIWGNSKLIATIVGNTKRTFMFQTTRRMLLETWENYICPLLLHIEEARYRCSELQIPLINYTCESIHIFPTFYKSTADAG
jgi:hypothetical protein